MQKFVRHALTSTRTPMAPAHADARKSSSFGLQAKQKPFRCTSERFLFGKEYYIVAPVGVEDLSQDLHIVL